MSSNRGDQKCVCSRDVTIIAKGTEGYEIFYRKVIEKLLSKGIKWGFSFVVDKILMFQRTIYPWERSVRATPTRITTIRVKVDGTALVGIIVLMED